MRTGGFLPIWKAFLYALLPPITLPLLCARAVSFILSSCTAKFSQSPAITRGPASVCIHGELCERAGAPFVTARPDADSGDVR